MKEVLISIKPKWCEKICREIGKDKTGKPIYEKTIEIRKGRPSEVPFRGLIYATKTKKWYKSGPLFISDESLLLADGKVEMCGGLKFWADGIENYHCLNGKVIGEFVCDKIYELFPFAMGTGIELLDEVVSPEMFCKESCLTEQEICDYIGEKDGYGWHISDLKIYDKPKELSEFYRTCPSVNHNCEHCITYGKPYQWDFDEDAGKIFCSRRVTRPPQSWMYVEEVNQ